MLIVTSVPGTPGEPEKVGAPQEPSADLVERLYQKAREELCQAEKAAMVSEDAKIMEACHRLQVALICKKLVALGERQKAVQEKVGLKGKRTLQNYMALAEQWLEFSIEEQEALQRENKFLSLNQAEAIKKTQVEGEDRLRLIKKAVQEGLQTSAINTIAGGVEKGRTLRNKLGITDEDVNKARESSRKSPPNEVIVKGGEIIARLVGRPSLAALFALLTSKTDVVEAFNAMSEAIIRASFVTPSGRHRAISIGEVNATKESA